MKIKKRVAKTVKNRKTSTQRIGSSKNSFYSSKVLIYSLLLLIGLIITLVAAQQQQITTQYAQTTPTTIVVPPTGTPTFGCLGGNCSATGIPPTVAILTPKPTAASSSVTIVLPKNPNGKTPPGFLNSISHRVANWLRKFIKFGGNPPGNPDIPGTNINPISSNSGNLNGAKLQGNRTIMIVTPTGAGKNASGGGTITPPTNQPKQSALQNFLNLIGQLFGTNSIPPKK